MKRPDPEAEAETHIGAIEGIACRNDVEYRQTINPVRKIDRHAVCAACTPVMSSNAEAGEAQCGHRFDLVAGEVAHRVLLVFRVSCRTTAPPIPTQVSRGDGESGSHLLRYQPPHEVCFGDAVEQEQWRTAAANNSVNLRRIYPDIELSIPNELQDTLSGFFQDHRHVVWSMMTGGSVVARDRATDAGCRRCYARQCSSSSVTSVGCSSSGSIRSGSSLRGLLTAGLTG